MHVGHWAALAAVMSVIGLVWWAAGFRIQQHFLSKLGMGSLEARKQWARRLADASFDGLLIHRNGTILQMNRALVRMLGQRETELVGTHFSNLANPAQIAALRTELEAPQPQISEFILLHADKTERFVEMASHTIEYDGLPATVTAIRNITAQRALEDRLAHLINNDALTGLPNRTQFCERLSEAIARNDRAGGTTAVLKIELDQLKAINERLGRAGGDSLLCQVAGRLTALTHETDTVGRLGGNNFGIVQPHTGAPNRTSSLANRLENLSAEPFIVDGKAVTVSVSVGIAIYPEHGTDADGLLRASGIALHQVSLAGGGGSRMFSHADAAAFPPTPPKVIAQNTAPANGLNNFRGTLSAAERLAQDLRQAISHGEISVDYQPVFAAKSMTIAGFEAFARWRHPREGMIAPDKFIPLADESGMSVAVGNFIMETACIEAVRCKAPAMAVNLSPLQFRDPQLPARIKEVLDKTGLPAGKLEVEVTEGMLTADPETALQALQAIRDIGVRVTLDDFVTGLSSLTSLSDFPFNKIKIEKRFIQALGQDASAEAIVAAILMLARNLRIEVTAEGVETDAQLTYMQEKGCNFLQGYLLGRPAAQAMVAGAAPSKPTLVAAQR
jgi:diguanylate cyclase (GGDEF)-like protein/PAS domain S-box-containing protein